MPNEKSIRGNACGLVRKPTNQFVSDSASWLLASKRTSPAATSHQPGRAEYRSRCQASLAHQPAPTVNSKLRPINEPAYGRSGACFMRRRHRCAAETRTFAARSSSGRPELVR